VSPLAGADHQGCEVSRDDAAFTVEIFQEPPKIGTVRVAGNRRKGGKKLSQERIDVFNAQRRQDDGFSFKVVMKGAQDPSDADKLGWRYCPGLLIGAQVVFERIRQPAMRWVYGMVDSLLVTKIPPQSSYPGPRGCVGIVLERFEALKGKDIPPANALPEYEQDKAVQLLSIGTTGAERIAGGKHPLQVLVDVVP